MMADGIEDRDGQRFTRKDGKYVFDVEDGEGFMKLGSYLCLLGKALADWNVEEFSYALHAISNAVANDKSEALIRLLDRIGLIEATFTSDEGITLEDLTIRASFGRSSISLLPWGKTVEDGATKEALSGCYMTAHCK